MTYTVVVFKGEDGYHVRIVHKNGKIMFGSEAYASRFNARRAGHKVARVFKLEYQEEA